MAHKELDRDRLLIRKLAERKNKVHIVTDHVPVTQMPGELSPAGKLLIGKTAGRIRLADRNKSQ